MRCTCPRRVRHGSLSIPTRVELGIPEQPADFTNDEFGTWYTTAISDTLYQAGDDYTLTFTLGAWPQATDSDAGSIGHRSGMIITLTSAKNWGLFTQAGQYLAFDNSGTNDRGSLVTSSGTYASSNTSEATGSVAQGVEGWFYSFGSTANQEGVTFTIARANLVDTITITKGAVKIADFTITGDSVSCLGRRNGKSTRGTKSNGRWTRYGIPLELLARKRFATL